MSLNQIAKDVRKPWLSARVETLRVDGDIEAGGFSSGGDMTVQGNLTVEGDISGQQDASLVGDLTANRVRVQPDPSGGVNFIGVGTLDWYSVASGSAQLQGSFIAANNPDVDFKLTRIGDVVTLQLGAFSVPNADLAASGEVFLELPGHLNFAPQSVKEFPIIIDNSDSFIATRGRLYLPAAGTIGISYYYVPENATFSKGLGPLQSNGLNIVYNFTDTV